MISKQREKPEFGGLAESTKSISATTDTSGPGAGEGAEVQAEVPLVCQRLKETCPQESSSPLTETRTCNPHAIPAITVPSIPATSSKFLPHPFRARKESNSPCTQQNPPTNNPKHPHPHRAGCRGTDTTSTRATKTPRTHNHLGKGTTASSSVSHDEISELNPVRGWSTPKLRRDCGGDRAHPRARHRSISRSIPGTEPTPNLSARPRPLTHRSASPAPLSHTQQERRKSAGRQRRRSDPLPAGESVEHPWGCCGSGRCGIWVPRVRPHGAGGVVSVAGRGN